MTLQGTSHPCTPILSYDPSLPTEPSELLARLAATAPDGQATTGGVAANVSEKSVLELLEFSYLMTPQRAGLVRAAEQFPAVKVDENAVDGAGRPGIEISWGSAGSVAPATLGPTANGGKPADGGPVSSSPYAGSFILDRGTYAFLGTKGGDTVLAVAIVDKVGDTGKLPQRPAKPVAAGSVAGPAATG